MKSKLITRNLSFFKAKVTGCHKFNQQIYTVWLSECHYHWRQLNRPEKRQIPPHYNQSLVVDELLKCSHVFMCEVLNGPLRYNQALIFTSHLRRPSYRRGSTAPPRRRTRPQSHPRPYVPLLWSDGCARKSGRRWTLTGQSYLVHSSGASVRCRDPALLRPPNPTHQHGPEKRSLDVERHRRRRNQRKCSSLWAEKEWSVCTTG